MKNMILYVEHHHFLENHVKCHRTALVSIITFWGIWRCFIYAKMMNGARLTGNKLLFGPIISHQRFFEIVNYMGLTLERINLCY